MPDQQDIEISGIKTLRAIERRSRELAGALRDCRGVVDLCDAEVPKRGGSDLAFPS